MKKSRYGDIMLPDSHAYSIFIFSDCSNPNSFWDMISFMLNYI